MWVTCPDDLSAIVEWVQVNVGAANYVRVGADRWNLLQYHFHTPSEHTIQGMHTAMECHFVHQHSVTGKPVLPHTARLMILDCIASDIRIYFRPTKSFCPT